LALQEARYAVRSGKIPVRLELAVILTATQIHVEELARLRAFVTPPKPLPNVKVKGFFPADLKVNRWQMYHCLHILLYFFLIDNNCR
jgi:hypothetical protein